MAIRTTTLTLKVTPAEAAQLSSRAAESGLPLRTYLRRELLGSKTLPRQTMSVLVATGRADEFNRRVWAAAAVEDVTPEQVKEIARQVDAIDDRVYLARANGGAK